MLNLDTHILLFLLADQLTSSEKATIQGQELGISSIVLWELAKLRQIGRIKLDLSNFVFVRALKGIRVWPISLEVVSNVLALDFTSDPADEIIASTSITYQVPLLTRDQKIRASRKVSFA